MVKIRINIFTKLFAACLSFIIGITSIPVLLELLDINIMNLSNILIIALVIIVVGCVSSYKAVFDDQGITITYRLWCLKFKDDFFIPWESDEIYEIDALNFFGDIITFWKPHKKKYANHEGVLLNLDQSKTNCKEAMRFAAEKLPPHKFNDKAREMLRKWGITV